MEAIDVVVPNPERSVAEVNRALALGCCDQTGTLWIVRESLSDIVIRDSWRIKKLQRIPDGWFDITAV